MAARPFPIRNNDDHKDVTNVDVVNHVVAIYNILSRAQLSGTRFALVDRGKDGVTYWHSNAHDKKNHLTVWYVRDQARQRAHIYSMTDYNLNPTVQQDSEELDAGSDFEE